MRLHKRMCWTWLLKLMSAPQDGTTSGSHGFRLLGVPVFQQLHMLTRKASTVPYQWLFTICLLQAGHQPPSEASFVHFQQWCNCHSYIYTIFSKVLFHVGTPVGAFRHTNLSPYVHLTLAFSIAWKRNTAAWWLQCKVQHSAELADKQSCAVTD